MQLYYTMKEGGTLREWPWALNEPPFNLLNKPENFPAQNLLWSNNPREVYLNTREICSIKVHSLLWMELYETEFAYLQACVMRWDCINGWTK